MNEDKQELYEAINSKLESMENKYDLLLTALTDYHNTAAMIIFNGN